MDMNDKMPDGTNGAAPRNSGNEDGRSEGNRRNRNRRRPSHGQKRSAEGGAPQKDNATPDKQNEQAESANRKKQPNPQQRSDRKPDVRKDTRSGNQRVGNEAPQKATAGKAPANEQNAQARNAAEHPASSHRPRVPHQPRKQAELPQMDNLLIEDCPTDTYDRREEATDPAEVERILSRDIFASAPEKIPEVIPEGKVVIVGIRFRTGGKTYFFDPGHLTCLPGRYAIVETARGVEFGEICIANRMVDESLVVPPLRPILRIATPEDIRQNQINREREEEAFRIGVQKIAAHKLDMKLVSVQYTFDNSKLLFYFTSAGRVDFRELVKDLAGVFHIRIELRQIGIRDEARMIGGLGACGRPLCCATFLSDFGQVSMKMAKEQSLSLNSTKISGCCGRLMCCLRYEHDTYVEEIRKTPAVGTFVNTPDGPGVVTEIMPLIGEIKVSLRNQPDSAPKKYNRADVTTQPGGGRNTPRTPDVTAEENAEPDTDE